jgi:uncharacterized protein (TIGR01777 family)
MKVLISGSSGLIGKALQKELKNYGHEVIVLVRDKTKVSPSSIFWDPLHSLIDISSLEGFDAIVNLSGENITLGRWNEARKEMILESRVKSTKTLVDALIRLKNPPKVLINASAIGYYGDRNGEICNENTSPGTGFLSQVCQQWERATLPAEEKGIRTVLLRTGLVLSADGGALEKMLTPFKLGVGGRLGSGKQYISWITIDDLVGIILFSIGNDSINGPINAVTADAVMNEDFTKALGEVLNRPTPLPIPEFMLKVLAGEELTKNILLSSTRVEPKKLLQEGYLFKYPNLEEALEYLVKKERKFMESQKGPKSSKSYLLTLLFCILLGTLGVHRFYVEKIGTGILMLVTFGGLGIWWLIDLIMIVAMSFRDKDGFLIEP